MGADIASVGGTGSIGRVYHPQVQGSTKPLRDCPGAIGRRVVDENDLPAPLIVLVGKSIQLTSQVPGAVPARDHDAHFDWRDGLLHDGPWRISLGHSSGGGRLLGRFIGNEI
jgi:hypothetical protein